MSRIKFASFLLWIIANAALAQQQNYSSIEGKVMDAKTKEALPFATVYLARTSIGVIADENGVFKIEKIPLGKYDLSATMLGYKPFGKSIQFDGVSLKNFMIMLVNDPSALDSVVVTARKTKNSSSAYNQFVKLFLGSTKNSYQCKILNRQDIVAYKENDRLYAFAKKPIEIMNNALGYKIYYTLSEFTVDYKADRMILVGSPRFEELKAESAKQGKKWIKERDRAYYGSPEHFLRSLKQYKLKENFFVVQADDGNLLSENDLIKDGQIQRNGTINVNFSKEIPENIRITTPTSYARTSVAVNSGQQSQISFSGKPVKVHDNGYFEDYHDIVFLGYFSFIDNISEMIPLGYEPSYKLNQKK